MVGEPMDHPLAAPAHSTTPPSTPRGRMPSSPPRGTPLSPPRALISGTLYATPSPGRSPRLGQATFDASVAADAAQAPPYSARPRQLFSSEETGDLSAPSITTQRSYSDHKRPPSVGDDGYHQDVLYTPSSLPGDKWADSIPATPLHSAAATTVTFADRSGAPAAAQRPPIPPTFRTLFSLTSRSTLLGVVLPGVAFAVGSGLIPPYMTILLGDALQAFTDYGLATGVEDLSPAALSAARSTLLDSIRSQSIKFFVLAAVVLIASASNVALWVLHGERVARELRTHVYRGVSEKSLAWYETGMGGNSEAGQDEASSAVDAAGLTGRFSK